MSEQFLFHGERMDEIGFGQMSLIQKPEEFCYGVDAVILADFAAKGIMQTTHMNTAVDLGTGTGVIPLILSHKTELEMIYGVEIQKDSCERAMRNAELNGLSNRLFFMNEDVSNLLDNRPQLRGYFDAVTTNPPYMSQGTGLMNKNEAKRIARHETTADLRDFIQTAAFLLRDKGEMYMVHRPYRLVDICSLCREYKIEPKELRFVSQNSTAKPNILLLRGVKCGKTELIVREPLYIYDEAGKAYSTEIMDIYER